MAMLELTVAWWAPAGRGRVAVRCYVFMLWASSVSSVE